MTVQAGGETTGPGFEVSRYIGALRRRGWLLLCPLIACPAIAYGISTRAATKYQASALIQVRASTALLNNGISAAQLLETVQVAATSPAAQQQARQALPRPDSLGSISIASDATDDFVDVTATASTPQSAAATANEYAVIAIAGVNKEARGDARSGIASLTTKYGQVRGPGSALIRQQLASELAQLTADADAGSTVASLSQAAQVPISPAGTGQVKTTVIGAVIGLLLGLGLIAIGEILDRRFRTLADVETASGLTVLATVPRKKTQGVMSEQLMDAAFARLRARLDVVDDAVVPKSVMIVSPGVAEGKTTVATQLAVSVAKTGRRVVLLETDLRRPQVANRFGLTAEVGLADLLADPQLLGQALLPVDVGGDRSLFALTCGPVPDGPAELLASPEFSGLLTHLKKVSDLVVVDSSPLLAVPDPLPLLAQVDAAVVVVRLGVTRADLLKRAVRVVAEANGRVVGLVVNGVVGGDPYRSSEYLRYYTAPSEPRRRRRQRRAEMTAPVLQSGVTEVKPVGTVVQETPIMDTAPVSMVRPERLAVDRKSAASALEAEMPDGPNTEAGRASEADATAEPEVIAAPEIDVAAKLGPGTQDLREEHAENGELRAVALEIETAHEPQVEPASEPEVEPASEPEVEPASEPEVEPASEPEVEPASQAEADVAEDADSVGFEASIGSPPARLHHSGSEPEAETSGSAPPVPESPDDQRYSDAEPTASELRDTEASASGPPRPGPLPVIRLSNRLRGEEDQLDPSESVSDGD